MRFYCFVLITVTITLPPQGTFYVTVHAPTDEQKEQRFMLSAGPFEKCGSLLEKAVKRFNRALGPDKEQGEVENYILKVSREWGRGGGYMYCTWTC